jgi:hypothetical protein
MIKTVFIFSPLVVLLLISSGFISEDWVVFKKDNYKIMFPNTPSSDSTVTETKIGRVTVYNHMFETPEVANDSNLVYGLAVTNYPAKFFLSTDTSFLNGFFDGAVKGAVINTSGKLLSEKKISFGNYPGREIKLDYSNGTAIISMKIILVKTKVFSLQTIAFPGKEMNSNASKFYNSFDVE